MNFRIYRPSDYDACMALFDSNLDKFFVQAERAEFSEYLKSLSEDYYVIEAEDGVVLGCGGIYVDEQGVGKLCWGMTHRQHHGQGLGKLLTSKRLERIKANPHARSVLLNTSQHTSGFYQKFGFQITKIKEHGFGPDLHDIEMVLDLSDRPAVR